MNPIRGTIEFRRGMLLTGIFFGERTAKPIPLVGVDIKIKVYDYAAKVTVTQGYRNVEDNPIEAVYSFPLPESAAVCGFEVETNNKKLIGRVEERKKAEELYADNVDEGHGAFLLEQDRPNIFTANIGNLLPHSSAIVKITYVQELNASNGTLRLLIPTTISPRYVPLAQLIKMEPVEYDHINPPVVLGQLPYGLHLTAEIDLMSGIKAISSPSHPVEIKMDDIRATVTLAGEDIQLDQDFVLNIEPKVSNLPIIRCAKDRDDYVAMFAFTPDIPDSSQNSEIIFILDRSGSMNGESIDQARKALLICLHSLMAGDRFNIIGFGSSYQILFPESAEYCQETLDRAVMHIERVQADLGGTEIYAPLAKALKMETNLPKKIILITDGEFGNEEAVIKLCQQFQDSVTIFPIGIGYGVNEYALKGIARATGGFAEFIHPNERIEPKVVRQFKRLRGANSSNLRIDWGAYGDGQMVPQNIPPIFPDDQIIVYKRFAHLNPGAINVYFENPDHTDCWTIKLDENEIILDDMVPILMARRRIQELESLLQQTHSPEGQKQFEQEIIALACRYGLMSSLTSYIAIETRPDADPTQPVEYRRVPIALTKGWGGFDRPCMKRVCLRSTSLKYMGLANKSKYQPIVSSSITRPKKQEKVQPDLTHDTLIQLITLQKCDGYWEYSRELADLFGFTLRLFHKIAIEQKLGLSLKQPDEVIATILVLDLLEKRFQLFESEWSIVAEKGYQWLQKQNIDKPQMQKILQILGS